MRAPSIPCDGSVGLTVRSGSDTLASWLAFATAFARLVHRSFPDDDPFRPQPNDIAALLHRRQSLCNPSLPLTELVAPITSTSIQWITFLTISGPTDHLRSGLVNLTKLVHLGALDIHNQSATTSTNPAVTDTLVRAWRRAAIDDGAFSRLRVLMLRNHDGITAQTLHYISDFPMLAILNCSDCSIRRGDKHQPNKSGEYWILLLKHSELLDQFGETKEVRPAKRAWHFPIAAAYEYAVDNESSKTKRPILNFRLGGKAEDDLYALSKAPLIFYRPTPWGVESLLEHRAAAASSGRTAKRPLSAAVAAPQPKKTKFRDSRHVDMGSMLREFGR